MVRIVKQTVTNVLIVMLFASCTHTEEAKSQTQDNILNSNFIEYLSKVQLPSSLEVFGEKVPLDNPEVKERADREFLINLQQPGRMLLYMKRAQRWFPLIEQILKEEDMPDDLKFLCVAESELLQARSPSGAIGFWQFIEETGTRNGLKINDYVDERKNVEKSTRAACRYLRNARKQLPSWTLCAAGYNQGVSGTIGDVEFQESDNYFDLHLNEETSRYVLRIAIIKHIMQNPSLYGFSISTGEMYQPYNTKTVSVMSGISNLTSWAKEHGTTYKMIKTLNPWIKKRELPAPKKGESWDILVPKE